MPTVSRVLIVDETPETGEVLRALVERSGAEAVVAQQADHALRLAMTACPDLILLDSDSDRSADAALTRELHRAAGRTDTPVVVLGTAGGRNPSSHAGVVVAKPYHYGPLLRKIEGLLAARRAA